MKHLPKHLQPRYRYLGVVIETWADETVSERAFQRALWYAAGNLLGDPGSAEADPTVMRFRFADGDGGAVVRIRRGQVEPARAALACVHEVEGTPVAVRVRGVSGTVRACSESYLGDAGGHVDQRDVVVDGAERAAAVREGAYDVPLAEGYLGAASADFE